MIERRLIMDKKIKWGIIGLGDIAHSFAEVFSSDFAELDRKSVV